MPVPSPGCGVTAGYFFAHPLDVPAMNELWVRSSACPSLTWRSCRARRVGRHPDDALLIVEIAIASRSTDLGRKAAIYAQARVPDYWVVDVVAREVVVHREPVSDRYRLVRRMAEGEVVEAVSLPMRVGVDALCSPTSRPSIGRRSACHERLHATTRGHAEPKESTCGSVHRSGD